MSTRKLLVLAAIATTTPPAFAFDIAEDLFVTGDLHASWKAEPVTEPPKMFETLPKTANKGSRRLSRAGKTKGGVTAFQYDDADDAARAYDTLLEGMGSDTEVVDGLGDQARAFSAVTKFPAALGTPDFHRAGVLFMRGNTVVYISLSDMKAEELIPFAKKIDSRVEE